MAEHLNCKQHGR